MDMSTFGKWHIEIDSHHSMGQETISLMSIEMVSTSTVFQVTQTVVMRANCNLRPGLSVTLGSDEWSLA